MLVSVIASGMMVVCDLAHERLAANCYSEFACHRFEIFQYATEAPICGIKP
jgi:hypothetical protein